MMHHYLVAYDVVESKRRVRVAKLVYGYALGGQKSALEVPASRSEMRMLAEEIKKKIDVKTDRVHLIRVESDAILLGVAKQIDYEEGAIIL
jgi:CRISPR-associated protein Cas2